MTAPGQIVIVNGTSGSGKSTAVADFAKSAPDYWLQFGIDQFVASVMPVAFGHHGPRAGEGIEAVPVDPADPDGPLKWRFHERGARGFSVFHEWIASASRGGCNLILDHLLMTGTPVLADCAWRLAGLPVLLVTLRPPYEVLEQRVAERTMDRQLMARIMTEDAAQRIVERLNRLRPWFYESVYANDIADLVIDTSAHSPEQVSALIRTRLAEGPGTAMERLRAQLPRP